MTWLSQCLRNVFLVRHKEDGNVAIMAALFAPVIPLLLALAVDLGSLSVQQRQVQSVTDIAAIVAAGDMARAEERAMMLLSENGYGSLQLVPKGSGFSETDIRASSSSWVQVIKGHYVADPKISVSKRFTPWMEPYNAVQVTMAEKGQYYIMGGVVSAPVIKTSGVAHSSAEAAFSIGSRLARVEGGVLNALLGSLLGSNINLRVMDYEALIRGRVSLLSMLDILGTELDLTAASYEDILDTEISVSQLALALRQAGALDVTARAALNTIASNGGALSTRIRLSDAIDLGLIGKYGPQSIQSLPSLDVPVMELLTAAITASGGDHQVSLNLGANVPGLLKTKVDLVIGERPQNSPWLRMSDANAIVSTAQTRLKVEFEVPGLGILAGSNVRIPLYVEIASADAKLDSIACRTGASGQSVVRVAAQPSVARVMIGDIAPADFPRLGRTMDVQFTRIIDLLLLKVSAKADVRVGNTKETLLTFTQADIDAGRVKTTDTSNFTSSLLGSALRELRLRIDVAIIPIESPAFLQSLLATILEPVLQPVDAVVYNLLSVLGVHLGEADVRVHGVRCHAPSLVQ